MASPLIYISAGQVNAVAPFGLTGGNTITSSGGQAGLPIRSLTVAPAQPGIFSFDGSGAGQGAILNQDGSVNSAGNPAAAGSIITLWATGAGQLSPPGIDGAVTTSDSLPVPVLPVTAQIGGQAATVLYAGGAPGIVAGVIQVNLRVPRGTAAGAAVPLVLSVGGSCKRQKRAHGGDGP